jgi:hypothetical protein
VISFLQISDCQNLFLTVHLVHVWPDWRRFSMFVYHSEWKVVNPFLPVLGLASGEFFGSVNPELRDCSRLVVYLSLES